MRFDWFPIGGAYRSPIAGLKGPTYKGSKGKGTYYYGDGKGIEKERAGDDRPCLSSENPLKCALACPVTHTYRKTSNILWVSAYFRPITDSSATVLTRSDCQFCQSAVRGLIIIAH